MLSTVEHPSGGEVVFDRISGFISPENQDKIEEYLIKTSSFPWYYYPETVVNLPEGSTLKNFEDIVFQAHTFVSEGKLGSEYFQTFIDLLNLPAFLKKYRINANVYRSHANLFLKRDRPAVSCPHIDFRNYKHTVVLYYVNDCDGDTIFYDKCEKDGDILSGIKEWRRESPKKGDFVVFDGSIYHSITCPIHSRCRSTLNLDIKS